MDFILKGHNLEHAVQTVIQIFCPNEGYKRLTDVPERGRVVQSELRGGVFYACVYSDGAVMAEGRASINAEQAADNKSFTVIDDESSDAVWEGKREATQAVALSIYDALSELTSYCPPWGTLTGVRPAKIVTDLLNKGRSAEDAAGYLRRAYRVREDKISLCMEVAAAEKRFIDASEPLDVGVYIGIPFCPTRCHYCSFTSYPLAKYGHLREAYLSSLCKEIDYLGQAAQRKHIRAVYVGGGTPTALEPDMLDKLLERIHTAFGTVPELTVEAGRPDSVTQEKLDILRRYNVTRLALNPQTMSDETLARIGRSHTSADFLRAYELAVEMGFNNINCDVILGLPGETAADAERTFTELARLSPVSVTVHTLALKRAAELNKIAGRYMPADKHEQADVPAEVPALEEMLDISRSACDDMGLKPYYMYRQKNMIGNFENVGYAVPSRECAYNLQTMTEAVSVYAAGAGAVTKVIYPEINLIKRAFNVKSLDEYLSRTDEMIERKRQLIE